ncbi:hypothetical protein [Chryseobacterium oryzae]|uniref:Uncharacterized protein n=1 Tax=Chryseobacterium oryzae TaxID=2929799 RepID=A0ABY4BJ11_9FLAO|nr:hypothetical protein [Chryseobacterium oryzae]UOE39172.1 hypothetical protein MTP08_05225 [Chryseobacterium oryzae]
MDKKAKNILFKTFWSSQGWLSDENRKLSSEDFEYAKEKGLMFEPISITKKELLEKLRKTVNEIPLSKITNAFLSSLTNKRLDWRSGLASYRNAERILQTNNYSDYLLGFGENEDLNILNFERIKWSGVRHSNGLYNLLDLTLLQKEIIPQPTEIDIQIFQNILDTINTSKIGETPSILRDRLSEVIKSSKNERHMLMEILGCADILQPLRFDRKEPGKHDWTFVLFWRGEDKYNKENVKKYFKEYGIK